MTISIFNKKLVISEDIILLPKKFEACINLIFIWLFSYKGFESFNCSIGGFIFVVMAGNCTLILE